ncbi:MAG: type II secretion system protein N [Pseudomonadota bacterium]
MKRKVVYVLTGITTFLVFLVVFAPAALLWNLVKVDVLRTVPELQVLTVDGTVWQGDANLRFREFPVTDLNWTLAPLPLVRQQLAFSATLAGDGLNVASEGTASEPGSSGTLDGYIDASYINSVASRYGMNFPGRILLEQVTFAADRTWLTTVSGLLRWGGGRVVLQTPAGTQAFLLPPLEGQLRLTGNNLQLDVSAREGLVISVLLRPDGWAAVDIKTRLLQVAGIPWPGSENADLTAFMLEEKVF